MDLIASISISLKHYYNITLDEMGIPSYYKKLTHTIKGLVSIHNHDIEWLFMDFNCMIYHCIASQPPYEENDVWEQGLIETVCKYCREVVKEVGARGVFIAIDGVVPMAKMRQQRLRRFKSVWEQGLADQQGRVADQQGRVADQQGRVADQQGLVNKKWNTNAITPGTRFMEKLCQQLGALCAERGWTLSGSDDPGVGEHKIMAQWRRGIYKGDIAVYGLDADLIVLSLLGQAQNKLGKIWLFREALNKTLDKAAESFEWFSIDALRDHITVPIYTYCFAMSVLGNDFLPSSLGLKMRDGGHDEMMRCLTVPLVDEKMNIIPEHLIIFFQSLAQTEYHRMTHYVQTKQRMSHHAVEKGLGENNWPLTQIETWILGRNWISIYWGNMNGTPQDICKDYINGMKWIWAYYTGRPICYNWFYPHVLPPLWSSLHQYLGTHETGMLMQQDMPIDVQIEELKAVEQLCLVLPLESWSLIPECVEKKIAMLAPQFFPSQFEFESIGKRFFWECEAAIPIPTILELKMMIEGYRRVAIA
jgi:5'-3' exonuclease